MPSFEVNEFIVLIFMSAGIGTFLLSCYYRRVMLKYLPAFASFWFTLFSTNMEAFAAPDFFNFMEHFCLMLSGIFMMLALISDVMAIVLKKKPLTVLSKQAGGRQL